VALSASAPVPRAGSSAGASSAAGRARTLGKLRKQEQRLDRWGGWAVAGEDRGIVNEKALRQNQKCRNKAGNLLKTWDRQVVRGACCGCTMAGACPRSEAKMVEQSRQVIESKEQAARTGVSRCLGTEATMRETGGFHPQRKRGFPYRRRQESVKTKAGTCRKTKGQRKYDRPIKDLDALSSKAQPLGGCPDERGCRSLRRVGHHRDTEARRGRAATKAGKHQHTRRGSEQKPGREPAGGLVSDPQKKTRQNKRQAN